MGFEQMPLNLGPVLPRRNIFDNSSSFVLSIQYPSGFTVTGELHRERQAFTAGHWPLLSFGCKGCRSHGCTTQCLWRVHGPSPCGSCGFGGEMVKGLVM